MTDDRDQLGSLDDFKQPSESPKPSIDTPKTAAAIPPPPTGGGKAPTASILSSPMLELRLEAGEVELLDIDSVRRVHAIEGVVTLYAPDILVQIVGENVYSLLPLLKRRQLDTVAVGQNGVTQILRYDHNGEPF